MASPHCGICGDPIRFMAGKGWLHRSTGTIYIQRKRTPEELKQLQRYNISHDPEELIDDHAVQPITNIKPLK